MTIQEVLLTALGTLLTGIASYLVVLLTTYLNSKIKDEKLKRVMNNLSQLIVDEVNYTTQVFVDNLKDKDLFDESASKQALHSTLDHIKEKLTKDMSDYILENYGDINDYLISKIESTIHEQK